MKSRLSLFFLACMLAGTIGATGLLFVHLSLPPDKLGVTPEVYKALIVKWFLAGWVLGMMVMFFLIESWIWKNWHSWNKFCCDHHERVYRSTMGISTSGRMLRR